MKFEDHKEFIKKAKENYKKIGYVKCPAFSDEKVYFTNVGFNHLLRKGRKIRKKEEQLRRISLLKFGPKIIETSRKYATFFKSIKINKPVAYFWSFIAIENRKRITVIVRQLEKGFKHFFSIF